MLLPKPSLLLKYICRILYMYLRYIIIMCTKKNPHNDIDSPLIFMFLFFFSRPKQATRKQSKKKETRAIGTRPTSCYGKLPKRTISKESRPHCPKVVIRTHSVCHQTMGIQCLESIFTRRCRIPVGNPRQRIEKSIFYFLK